VLNAATTGHLAELTVAEVLQLCSTGATVLDVRPVTDYAAAHVPASVAIPLREQFATWLGWLVQPEASLVVVRNADQDVAEVVWQAVKIGFDRIAGELIGGIDAWTAAGQPTASTALLKPDQLADRRVLDIRQLPEFADGHLPGALHIELGAVERAAGQLSDAPTVVMCGHGERAATAASLLERAGQRDLAVLGGSAEDWAKVTGRDLETTG